MARATGSLLEERGIDVETPDDGSVRRALNEEANDHHAGGDGRRSSPRIGSVKFLQIRAAIAQGASFQPPPEAVTTIVAARGAVAGDA